MAKTKRKVAMPSGIRSKLTAAVAMLLVSLILLVSSTYAWFTLSTAPEVKNITTTVAGNGSLEIALMPQDGLLGSIKNGLSSTVGGGAEAIKNANVTWGNLLTLSTKDEDPYGLGKVTLMPALLNNDALDLPGASLLGTAAYGIDGRATEVVYNMVQKSLGETSNKFDSKAYGVRAVGQQIDGDLATYGYIVDLAMRINTQKDDGSDAALLLQSDPAQRIYGESGNAATQGGGSYMEFTSEMGANVLDLMKAIRVTFVADLGRSGGEGSYEVLGTATLDMDAAKVSGNVQFNLGKDAFGPAFTLGKEAYTAKAAPKTLLGQEAFEPATYVLGKDAYTADKYVLGKNAYRVNATDSTQYDLTPVAKTVYNAGNTVSYNETITAEAHAALPAKTAYQYKLSNAYVSDKTTLTAEQYNALATRTVVELYALKAEYTNLPDYQNADKLTSETISGATKQCITAEYYKSLEAANKVVDYELTDKTKYNEDNCTNFAEALTEAEYNDLGDKTESLEYALSSAAKKIYTAKNTLNYPADGKLTREGYAALVDKTTTPHAKAYLTLGADNKLTMLQKNAAKQISALVWLNGDEVDSGDFAIDGNSLTGSLNLQFTTDATLYPTTNESLNKALNYTEHTYSIDSKTYYKASGNGRWYTKTEGQTVDGKKQPDTYTFVGTALNDKLDLDVKLSEGTMTTKTYNSATYHMDLEDGVWYTATLEKVTDQSLIKSLNEN